MQNVLDLDAIVFGGGVSASFELIEPALRATLSARAHGPPLGDVPLLVSELKVQCRHHRRRIPSGCTLTISARRSTSKQRFARGPYVKPKSVERALADDLRGFRWGVGDDQAVDVRGINRMLAQETVAHHREKGLPEVDAHEDERELLNLACLDEHRGLEDFVERS